MEYTREKAVQLADLIRKGINKPEVETKAREYIRGYLANNPQEKDSGLASVQAIRGGQMAAAPAQSGVQAFEAAAPDVARQYSANQAELDAEKAARSPAQYPPEFAREAAMHPQKTTIAEQQRQQFHQAAQQADDALGQALDSNKDASLPSASRVKNYYRPPESVAGAGNINGISANAPIYYSEPSLDEFKREMQPQFASGVNQFTEDSPAFQVWRDMRYASAYDRAKALGKPIVRVDYAQSGEWKKRAQKVLGGVSAALPAALEAGTLNLSKLVLPKAMNEENQLLQEASPTGSTVGGVAGMFAPGNLAERAFGGIAKGINAIPGVRQLETSGLGRIGMAGVKGGVGAAGVGAAEDVANALNTAIEERSASGLAPDAETGKRALVRAAIGMPIGMGFELLGASAQKGRDYLRSEPAQGHDFARAMSDLDAAGAQSTMFGIKGSPAMRDVEARAAAHPEKPSAVEIASTDLEGPILKNVGARQESGKALQGKGIEYAIGAEGRRAAAPWEAIDEALKQQKRMRFSSDGKPLPGARDDEKALNALIHGRPQLMDWQDAEELARKYPDTVRMYSPNELRRRGLDIGKVPTGQRFVVRAKKMTAEDAYNTLHIFEQRSGPPAQSARERVAESRDEPLRASFREFVRNNFPHLDSAIEANQSVIAARRLQHTGLSLPDELTVQRVGPKYPEYATPENSHVILEGEKATRFQKGLRNPLPSKEQREAQTYAAGPENADLLKTLRGELAKTLFETRGQGRSGVSMSSGGVHAFQVGHLQGALRRSDAIMKALAQMPEEQAQGVVAAVKKVNAELSPRLRQAIAASDATIADVANMKGKLGPRVYSAEELAAMRDSGISEEVIAEMRKSSRVTEEMRAGIRRAGNAVAKEIKAWQAERAKPQPKAKPLETSTLTRVPSIRGGRPGRAAAVYGQGRPKDLSKEELHLLTVLLLAPEAP